MNELEDLMATMTGKERALFVPSGTMGNSIALLTHCRPGDVVLVDEAQHLLRTEKVCFDGRFGQLKPALYRHGTEGFPDVEDVSRAIQEQHPKLLAMENTHNSAGGTCIPLSVLAQLRALADEVGIPIHMDGARVFNAATALGVKAEEICRYADTVMVCISKGLGAPIGSLLCCSDAFTRKAAETRKMLGGSMRQAGVVAAMGTHALKHAIPDLAEDHRRARQTAEALRGLKHIHVVNEVQTNMLILDISSLDTDMKQFLDRAKSMGIWLSKSTDTHARIVFYRDISDQQMLEAIEIMKSLDASYD